ncbi:MAG: DMT family transporter [Cyclobacteriaceae bacterium]
MTQQKTPALAWILLISLALVWGSSFILIKKGLVVLSAGEVGALRVFSAGAFVFFPALYQLKHVSVSQLKYILIVGLFGSLIPSFLFAIAQTRVSSSITGVLNALTPFNTVLIGLLFFKIRSKSIIYFGMGLGLVGTAILILTGSDGQLQLNAYGLFIILATVLYGVNVNVIKYKLAGVNSMTITSLSLAMVGPAAGIYLFGFTPLVSHMSDEGGPLAIAYICVLGVVGTAIALIIFNKLVQLTDPVFTASVTYLIPIVAISWGLLDGERLSFYHLIGMVTILGGVYITNIAGRS